MLRRRLAALFRVRAEPGPPRPSWISPERRRLELGVVGAFATLNLVVPVLTAELFPFSRFWLFADAPRRYCHYEIRTSEGKPVPPQALGLQRNYNGAQPYRYHGRVLPPTIDRFGDVAREEEVRAQARGFLAEHPAIRFLDVQQDVIGAADQDRVGVVSTRRWRIYNAADPPG